MKKFDNLYHEIYAMLALDAIYPTYSMNMKKGECPDWDDESTRGLEVTRAQTKHMGYTKNVLINQYLGKAKKEIPANIVANFKGELYFKFYNNEERLNIVTPHKGLIDTHSYLHIANESIAHKLERLNSSDFTTFNNNELFVFLGFAFNAQDIECIKNEYEISIKRHRIFFSKIYLFDNSSLWAMASCCDDIAQEDMSPHLAKLKTDAIRKRNESNWKDRTPFV